MDGEVQNDWEFQKLRRHYCGLMEELFEGINRTKDPSRWMTFEYRKSSFALMEDWCGFSPNQAQIRQREDSMRRSMIDQQTQMGDRGTATAAMEIEKKNLRTAALSAMASLCVSFTNKYIRKLFLTKISRAAQFPSRLKAGQIYNLMFAACLLGLTQFLIPRAI